MKSSILLLLLFCRFPLRAEDVLLELAYYGENGKRTYYFVPSEELKKVKPWSPVEGRKVPLSRDQAVEIARRAMSERGPQRPKVPALKVKLTRANPFEKSVVNNLPADVCDWYYVVDFQAIDTQKANALRYSFLVSMSGAVARTEVK